MMMWPGLLAMVAESLPGQKTLMIRLIEHFILLNKPTRQGKVLGHLVQRLLRVIAGNARCFAL